MIRLATLYLAFFLSGAAALAYESVWTRYLGLLVGHDAFPHPAFAFAGEPFSGHIGSPPAVLDAVRIGKVSGAGRRKCKRNQYIYEEPRR